MWTFALWIWTNAVDICEQIFVWTCFHSLGNIPKSRIPGESCLMFSGTCAFGFTCKYNLIISFIPWFLLTARGSWQFHFCKGSKAQSTQRTANNKKVTACTECQHMPNTRPSDLTAISRSILTTAYEAGIIFTPTLWLENLYFEQVTWPKTWTQFQLSKF